MNYIQNVKRKDNINLFFMNHNFTTEIGMESYVGGAYIEVKGSFTGKIYKVLLDQFSNIEVNKNIYDKLVVIGDEKRIEQVVRNFITNDIKYILENENINIYI